MCFEDLQSYVLKYVITGIMVREERKKISNFKFDRQHTAQQNIGRNCRRSGETRSHRNIEGEVFQFCLKIMFAKFRLLTIEENLSKKITTLRSSDQGSQ